jgi:hypothetical protein
MSTKGFLVNINSAIDPSTYNEIGTKNYWINNSLKIWNCLTVSLGLKTEFCYTPINIILIGMYKNSVLVKIWRTFEIEIKNDQIKLKTFFQLQFMKEIVRLGQIFINMVNRVIIDVPAIERHLERVIQMLILPLEAMPIYGIMIELDVYIDAKRSQRHLGLAEREWMFEQRQLWQLERHNAFKKNRMPARFIGRQPNLIINNLIRETSLNNNSVSTSPLRDFSQDNIQERRHQKRRS